MSDAISCVRLAEHGPYVLPDGSRYCCAIHWVKKNWPEIERRRAAGTEVLDAWQDRYDSAVACTAALVVPMQKLAAALGGRP